MDIKSKADYNAVSIALQKAQDAVNKVSDSEKQQFIDRLNAKTDALNKEKQVIEAAIQKATTNASTNGQTNNSNGTTNTNNSNSTNGTTNGTTNSNGTNGTTIVPNQTQSPGNGQ